MDTLRTVAMLLVVLLHVSGAFVVTRVGDNNFDMNLWLVNFIFSFTRISVPLFVLISGRFLVGRIETFKVSYKKRASRLIIPLIVWTIIYITYKVIRDYAIHGVLHYEQYLLDIFNGVPFYHMWFLYMLLGLYFITPVLNYSIVHIKRKNIWYLAIFFMALGIIIINGNKPVFFLSFIKFLGYFIFGYLIRDMREISLNKLILIFVISIMLLSQVSFIMIENNNTIGFMSYFSPCVIIASLTLYKIFSQKNIKNNILSKITHLSFGIYLVHAGILQIIEKIIVYFNVDLLSRSSEQPIIAISLKFAIVFFLSYIISFLIYNIKFLRKII